MKGHTMYQTCHHVMPNGLRCQSPAMRGCTFCYFHGRRSPVRKAAPGAACIQMPATLDSKGITQTLHQVLNALANNRISARRASILLYGIQMAIHHRENPGLSQTPIGPSQVDFAQLATDIVAMLAENNADSTPD